VPDNSFLIVIVPEENDSKSDSSIDAVEPHENIITVLVPEEPSNISKSTSSKIKELTPIIIPNVIANEIYSEISVDSNFSNNDAYTLTIPPAIKCKKSNCTCINCTCVKSENKSENTNIGIIEAPIPVVEDKVKASFFTRFCCC
jgi:hypothetical protein